MNRLGPGVSRWRATANQSLALMPRKGGRRAVSADAAIVFQPQSCPIYSCGHTRSMPLVKPRSPCGDGEQVRRREISRRPLAVASHLQQEVRHTRVSKLSRRRAQRPAEFDGIRLDEDLRCQAETTCAGTGQNPIDGRASGDIDIPELADQRERAKKRNEHRWIARRP